MGLTLEKGRKSFDVDILLFVNSKLYYLPEKTETSTDNTKRFNIYTYINLYKNIHLPSLKY